MSKPPVEKSTPAPEVQPDIPDAEFPPETAVFHQRNDVQRILSAVFSLKGMLVAVLTVMGVALVNNPTWVTQELWGRFRDHWTWMQIESEGPGEFLVLIAPLRPVSVESVEEHRKIKEVILAKVASQPTAPSLSVRIEFIPWHMNNADEVAQAESRGYAKNASIVIWGDLFDSRVDVRLLNRRHALTYGKEISDIFPEIHSTVTDDTFRINREDPSWSADLPGLRRYSTIDVPQGAGLLALSILGEMMFLEQEYDRALSLFEEILTYAQDHDEPTGAEWMVPPLLQLHELNRERPDGSQGTEQILPVLRKLLPETHPILVMVELNATYGIALKDFAETKFKPLEKAHPESPLTLVIGALLFEELKDQAKSLAYAKRMKDRMKELLEDYPDNPDILDLLATAHRFSGEQKLAIAAYEQAYTIAKTQSDISSVRVLGNLASSHWLNEEFGLAEAALTRALAHASGSFLRALILNWRADVRSDLGEMDLAKQDREEVIKLREGIDDFRWTLHNLALQYADVGDCRRAVELEKRALANDYYFAAANNLLFECLYALSDVNGLRELLDRRLADTETLAHLLAGYDACMDERGAPDACLQLSQEPHPEAVQAYFRAIIKSFPDLLALLATVEFAEGGSISGVQQIIEQLDETLRDKGEDAVGEHLQKRAEDLRGFALGLIKYSGDAVIASELSLLALYAWDDPKGKNTYGYYQSVAARLAFERGDDEEAYCILMRTTECCPLAALLLEYMQTQGKDLSRLHADAQFIRFDGDGYWFERTLEMQRTNPRPIQRNALCRQRPMPVKSGEQHIDNTSTKRGTDAGSQNAEAVAGFGNHPNENLR